VYLFVASWQFRSWYLIWLVALAAVLIERWPARRTIAWTAGAMAVYALFIWVWHWWRTDFVVVQRIAVAVMFLPPLLASVGAITGRVVAGDDAAGDGTT
jgi:hypothetical protein